jgi:hypothetical protein
MKQDSNNKTPFFKSWNQWYALVIGFLIVLIIFFYLLTQKFS